MDSLFLQQKFEGLLVRSKMDFVFHNVFLYKNESDVLACKDGVAYEYEFKIGKSDFRKDIKKGRHTDGIMPNYFFYVVSSVDIISGEYLDYAGIYVHNFQTDGRSRFKLIKQPTLLNEYTIDEDLLYKLLKKVYNGKVVR